MNRIKQLRIEKNIKQAELAKAVQVSQAALSGYETEKYEADLDTYRRIADYLGVPLGYLLGADDASMNAIRVPVYGRIPAGIPLEAISDILDWEELPQSMARGGWEYFAVRVSGDSMWPDYLEGDVVIVRKTETCVSGDVCVVYVNGYDATLKQVKLDEAAKTLTIVPRNPSYPPRTFSREEIRGLPVRIGGVVVELRRKIK